MGSQPAENYDDFFSKEAEISRFLCAILQTVGLLNVTSVLDKCASGLA